MPKSAGKEHKQKQRRFWFCLSLTFAASYGLLAMSEGFSSEYVVQEDARQHIVWMLRFLDPELFPHDPIADYFHSVAPGGYVSLYRLAAIVGINPLLFSKLLPPVIGVITSGYCFAFCWQVFPVPAAGFFSTLLLNQNLWMKDDLASATPRAFAYPLLLAFLYYLSRRSVWWCSGAIALMGLFYPQCVFLGAGIVITQLFQWQAGQLKFNPKNLRFCAIALSVAFVVMLPYGLASSTYGPTITAAQAKQLPEFLAGGRSAFFEDFATFWFFGGRSGIFPELWLTPLTLAAGFLLPLLLNPARFPLARKIQPAVWLLPQLLLVSLSLFFTAHTVLFKLHLPNRYTSYSLRILLALTAGIALTILLDWLLKAGTACSSAWMQIVILLLVALVGGAILCYPSFLGEFPKTKYKTGYYPELYEFLQHQPQDIAIASLTAEADNIPAFAQRSVLVAPEYAIPYHLGYYLPLRSRLLALIQAQYSLDLAEVKQFIEQYQVDYWLLDQSAFTPEYLEKSWLQQYQLATDLALKNLHADIPALATLIDQCSVLTEDDLILLSAECISLTPVSRKNAELSFKKEKSSNYSSLPLPSSQKLKANN